MLQINVNTEVIIYLSPLFCTISGSSKEDINSCQRPSGESLENKSVFFFYTSPLIVSDDLV